MNRRADFSGSCGTEERLGAGELRLLAARFKRAVVAFSDALPGATRSSGRTKVAPTSWPTRLGVPVESRSLA
jgi:hypothetical protein